VRTAGEMRAARMCASEEGWGWDGRKSGPDARRGFQSIRRLFRRIARCVHRPLVALRLGRPFGAGRGGQGRYSRGRGGGRCPVGAVQVLSCHVYVSARWVEDER